MKLTEGIVVVDGSIVDLPLIYMTPPGWPTPTYAWMLANQGKSPDSASVAAAGLPPAPQGWTFWVERKVLDERMKRAAVLAAYAPRVHESRPGLGTMGVGFLIFAVGVLITIATYTAAAPGGVYVVTWGAIVFGAIHFIGGIVTFVRGY